MIFISTKKNSEGLRILDTTNIHDITSKKKKKKLIEELYCV